MRQFMLMLPVTFTQQTPRAAANDRAANFFARDHSEAGERPSGSLFQFAMRQPKASRSPCWRTCENTRAAPIRAERPRRRRFGDAAGMTRESNRRETFAARAPATGQGGPTAPGLAAGKKSVLTFAADFRWLILAFHKLNCVLTRKNSVERSGTGYQSSSWCQDTVQARSEKRPLISMMSAAILP